MTTPAPSSPAPPPETPFRSAHTAGFPELLERHGLTLLVTTYQAGKLMAVRAAQGRVVTLLRSFERPMGLAVQGNRWLALGTRSQVWLFQNAPDIAAQLPPPGTHDACFVPRTSFVTGDIRGHEMAWVSPVADAGSPPVANQVPPVGEHVPPVADAPGSPELWVVNTFFSCLCTLRPDYSFWPRWRPPFVSAVTPEDRCHLNGLAVAQGRPQYVTALGETDVPEGWRPTKATGGILMDVPAGRVLVRGLSMPHSPRLYAGRLWLLESGTGRLLAADPSTGKCEVVAEVPGFARGLAFFGPYAFIGLSKIRETAMFGGLPIAERVPDLRCGVWVIDLRGGQTAELMQFEAGIEEIFAVEILPGLRFPEILGFQEPTVHGTFVLPPGAEAMGAPGPDLQPGAG